MKSKIAGLGLPEGSFIVVGSGILHALGIRTSDDIDMVVSQEVFDALGKAGWEHGSWSDQEVLRKDEFDLGTQWSGQGVEGLLGGATVIGGVPYLSLADLRAWKVETARPKDIRDVQLIDDYLARQPKQDAARA